MKKLITTWITLVTMAKKLLYEKVYRGNRTQINVIGLPVEQYVLLVYSASRSFVKPVLIIK
jgi:hypothetical protein